MTDGPYDSSIRSNTPSGLGGLWTLLNTIAGGLGSLPQIAADVAAIRVLAERLVGTGAAPSGWAGLPGYLHTLVGTPLEKEDFSNRSLYVATSRGANKTARLVDYITGFNSTIPEYRGEDFYAAVVAMRAELELAQDDIAALLAVTGDINGDPVGSTNKDLLRSIDSNTLRAADCCEEGGGGDGLNDPPTTEEACDLGEVAFRATGYSGPFTTAGIDVYGLQFAGISTASGGELVEVLADAPFDTWTLLRPVAVNLDICLVWNLSTGQVPAGGNAVLIPVSGDINDGSGTAFSYSLGPGGAGVIARDNGLHLLYEVQMPEGVPPPPLNFWVRWQLQPA